MLNDFFFFLSLFESIFFFSSSSRHQRKQYCLLFILHCYSSPFRRSFLHSSFIVSFPSLLHTRMGTLMFRLRIKKKKKKEREEEKERLASSVWERSEDEGQRFFVSLSLMDSQPSFHSYNK